MKKLNEVLNDAINTTVILMITNLLEFSKNLINEEKYQSYKKELLEHLNDLKGQLGSIDAA